MLFVWETPRDDYSDLILASRIRILCVTLHGTTPAKLVVQYNRQDGGAFTLPRFNVKTIVLIDILLHLLRNKP
jgi:hypothetical protein